MASEPRQPSPIIARPAQAGPPEGGATRTPPLDDATPPPAAIGPITAGERIDVVDVLRGFALFGVLCVNMQFFAHPFPLYFTDLHPFPALHNRIAGWFIQFFCTAKFYSLFSFLFGLGMAIQMTRVEARGGRFVRLYSRRLAILLLIGLGHVVFLWNGDILVHYALLGFVLLLFRKRKRRTLIASAIPCFFLATLALVALIGPSNLGGSMTGAESAALPTATQPAMAPTTLPAVGDADATTSAPTTQLVSPPAAQSAEEEQMKAMQEWLGEAYEAYGRGTYLEALAFRLAEYPFVLFITVAFMWGGVFGMFLLGLYTVRRGLFSDIPVHLPFIRKVGIVGCVLGVAGNLVVIVGAEFIGPMEASWIAVALALGNALGAPALCLCYAASIILLYQRDAWRRRLSPLAAVGRMALTNYLMHSVICTLIFNGYGLGLFGQINPAMGLLLTTAIFGAQILLSNLWLRRFRFGPAEWLWRLFTYGKRPGARTS
jgi:uncharacterized protein